MSQSLPVPSDRALARAVHEIVDFVDAEGWDRPPVMFALVPTVLLAAAEPSLADQLDDGHEYTPIAQESFPDDVEGGSPALEEFLATTSWPESVAGCALVQEVVVVPPDGGHSSDDTGIPTVSDAHSAAENARLGARSIRISARPGSSSGFCATVRRWPCSSCVPSTTTIRSPGRS